MEEEPELISSDLSKARGGTPSQGPERKNRLQIQCLKIRFRSLLFRNVRDGELLLGMLDKRIRG